MWLNVDHLVTQLRALENGWNTYCATTTLDGVGTAGAVLEVVVIDVDVLLVVDREVVVVPRDEVVVKDVEVEVKVEVEVEVVVGAILEPEDTTN